MRPDGSTSPPRRAATAGWLFIAFPMLIIVVFTAVPTVLGAGLSLFDWDGGATARFVGLSNYRAAFGGDAQMWRALRNTILFAVGTVPLTVVGSFLLASAVSASWFRGRAAARTVYFLPTVMSIVAVGFVWQWGLNPRSGLLTGLGGGPGPDWLGDTWLGLGTLMFVQVWRSLGFFLVLYVAAMSRVPRSVYDAAGVDGAGSWQATWRITWPAVRPMTTFLFVIGAIWALQVFDLDLVMTGWSPQRCTDMLNTHLFREFKNGRLGYASTIGVIVLALTALVTWIQFQRARRSAGAPT
ncbi:MAG: carbohydrate ABC transporter permease [Planctomycetota bacterium]|jgi:ABC-type sugar transport system permease subunit